jgi:hypothetical protein
MSEQPKSLAAKMAAIMGEVATMTKDGTNAAQKYNFTTAEQVKAALRPLLKKHKVALFANMLDVTRETSINKNGTTVVTVIAKMCFTLVCGDTGERMDCIWYGEANDYADKAVNKSATAALKYFLTNTFLLSTTEPESDEETIEQAAPAQMCDYEDCDEEVNPAAAAATLKYAGAVLCKAHYQEFKAAQEAVPA